MYKFHPEFKVIGNMPDFDESIIKKEPMFFSSEKQFVLENAGPITTEFVKTHLSDHDDWIIDSRVHMLMEGFYPCIPGWHHDDVPRNTPNGQPNYDNPDYKAIHRMALIGKSSFTQFLNASSTMPAPREGQKTYGYWNRIIEDETFDEWIYTAKSGEVIDFTWQDFHRGMPATESCWRWFIRASRNTDRKIINEIRTQVQVYLEDPVAGW